jgi:hypothetical protein
MTVTEIVWSEAAAPLDPPGPEVPGELRGVEPVSPEHDATTSAVSTVVSNCMGDLVTNTGI